MSILDVRLDLGFDYGASGGPDDFGTTVIVMESGIEKRNQRRTRPVGEWQLGNRNVRETDLATLQNVWHAVGGTANGFYYRDWNDYSAVAQPVLDVGGSPPAYQLYKRYSFGGVDYDRRIVRPDVEALYDDAVLIDPEDYEVDDTTGQVLLDVPPSGTLTWTGTFDVPARFVVQRFTAQFLTAEQRGSELVRIYAISGLAVKEILV